MKRTDVAPLGTSPHATPAGYGAANLQSAYNTPSSTAGTGQTVAIVDAFDDPTAESDLAVYRAQYGLPACTTAGGCLRKVNQNGATSPLPAANAGWAGEISLDLDMVSAICPNCNGCFRKVNQNGQSSPLPPLDNGQWSLEMSLDVDMVSAACPNCHIILVEANTTTFADLLSGVDTAVALGAKFVSLSFSEDDGKGQFFDAHLNHPGVVITAGTGDYGYSDGPQYPASSPYVVAVGGTQLTPASNARGWSETVWSGFFFGTGSGCSTFEPQPATQAGLTPCSTRALSDVSAVAYNLAIYDTFNTTSSWKVVGGTSAATPLIAAMYALAGNRPATDNGTTAPYANRSQLNDVTVGWNGSCGGSSICTAGIGWDGPTGLGTPNGVGAFRAGSTPPPPPANTVTVTNPGAQSSVVGTAASVQIRATDSVASTLSYKAAGLPAGLSINASTGLISGTPSTAGSSSVTVTVTDTTGASGTATFTWTVTPGSTGRTVTVTNPGNQSNIKGSQAGLQIKATDTVPSTLTYQVSGLPTGLSINTATGLIQGTPTYSGSYPVTVTATDPAGVRGSASFTWTITTNGPTTKVTLTNPGNQSTTKNTPVNLPLKVSSSAAFQVFKFSATGLPTGLTINTSTGVITGTPTASGTSTVTVTAVDFTGNPATITFTWTVKAAGTPASVISPGRSSSRE